MIYLAGFLAVIVFAAVLDRSGIGEASAKALQTSRSASKVLRDPALDDDAKERAMREASTSLVGSFLSISVRGAAAVVGSLLTLALFHVSGLAPFSAVVAWLSEPLIVVLMSVLVGAWFFLLRRS